MRKYELVPATTSARVILLTLKQAFLIDGVPRCTLGDNNGCMYKTEEKPEGCAIGILMNAELQEKVKDIKAGIISLSSDYYDVEDEVREWVGDKLGLLYDCQSWHDKYRLTEEGWTELWCRYVID